MSPHRRSLRVETALPVHWVRRRRMRLAGEVKLCNLHGMFIETPHEVEVNYVMDLAISMPWGAMSCIVVPKFCGPFADVHGVGVELRVMDLGDRELWAGHYRRLLEQRAVAVKTS